MVILNEFILVNQSFCIICEKPQKRVHRKCKEAGWLDEEPMTEHRNVDTNLEGEII